MESKGQVRILHVLEKLPNHQLNISVPENILKIKNP